MSETRTEIYAKLYPHLRLTDEHRAELRKKRGFTDETIDKLGFRSAGAYLSGVIDQFRHEYSESDLLDSGLLNSPREDLVLPNNQLLEPRVLIPYFDAEGKIYHLRPHKLGFKGVPIHAYSLQLIADNPKHIVFTEGEFKAAALMQWGIPALAIPGVSSFSGKHLERLFDTFREHGIEKVTVIFDNEIKNDPSLPSFKKNPEDRWDTPFWAYVMAWNFRRAGVTANIGVLPPEWMVDGKIDFDAALAQGRTRKDIERVISRAMTPREFLQTFSDEARRVLDRKLAIQFDQSPVRRNMNRYSMKRKRGEAEYEEVISNFIVNVKSTYFTPDGAVRYIEFVNEFGEVSETFSLEPGNMTSTDRFATFCMSKGSYIWQGTKADLMEIWRYELLRDMGDVIRVPEQIGEIKPGFWLFGNIAVFKGQIVKPDDDGVFWVDGVGYKPQSLAVDSRGESMEDAIPTLHESAVDIKEIMRHFRGALGGGYEANIGVGWVVATLFSRAIVAKFNCFPFPFPHGKRESGKSTVMRWIMAFFGSEAEGVALSETTQNYIMRALSYYSSLGIWFDEYRNEKNITRKDGYLRSAYNRQLSGKGIKESFGARGYTVRGTIAISGEELPRDNALFTRTVPMRLSAHQRGREDFSWMQANMRTFSNFVLQVLLRYDELEPKILEAIGALRSSFIATGIPDRAAENYAIIAGAYYVAVEQDDKFIRWMQESAAEAREEAEGEHMLSVFWDDISIMVTEHQFSPQSAFIDLTPDKDGLAVYLPGVYNKWAEYYRKRTGEQPFDRNSIVRYIRDEPYFESAQTFRFDGISKRGYILNIDTAPESIVTIAEIIQTRQERAASGNHMQRAN